MIRRLWRVTPSRAFLARQRAAGSERAAFAIAHDLAKQTGEFVEVCRLVPFNDWTVHTDGRVSFNIRNERIKECSEIGQRNERRS